MLILYVNVLSSKIAESFTTRKKYSYLKGTATRTKRQTEICGKVTSTQVTFQKDVNADCHFISSFIKLPLFKEQPHERRINGNEPTKISMVPLDVFKLSRKTRRYASTPQKIWLRGAEEKAVSIQAHSPGLEWLRTICSFSNP